MLHMKVATFLWGIGPACFSFEVSDLCTVTYATVVFVSLYDLQAPELPSIFLQTTLTVSQS